MTQPEVELWDLPVFRNKGLDRPITARERKRLTKEQQRRWDYFFRCNPADIDAFFAPQIEELLRKRSAAQDRLTGKILLALLLVSGLVCVAWLLSKAVVMGWLILVVAVPLIFPILSGQADANECARKIREFEENIRRIKSYIPKDIPSDREMKEHGQRVLEEIVKRARKELVIGATEITVEADLTPMVEWGRLQVGRPGYECFLPQSERESENAYSPVPPKMPGEKLNDTLPLRANASVARQVQPENENIAPVENALANHLHAYRRTKDGDYLFAVIYVQILFPTRDYISIFAQFWDVILNEPRGLLTDEFYYSDITSVRTEARQLRLFGKQIEATTFYLSVSSGDAVSITLLDEKTAELMEARKSDSDVSMGGVSPTAGYRSVGYRVVHDIRHQLRQKKTTRSV